MYPTPAQAEGMEWHCGHARFVYNVAVEQLRYRHHGQRMPSAGERGRQLTEARQEFEWLTAGSQTIQAQALRDFEQSLNNWFGGVSERPTWRKRGDHDGFRMTRGDRGITIKQLNRKWAQVHIPKVGWVKYRQTKSVTTARSFRVTLDPVGRWHIAFPVVPAAITGPEDQSIVGVDRGVVVTLACSDGTMCQAPKPADLKLAAQALTRCKRGSNRRLKAKTRLARVHARNRDRRKDFVEKATTHLADNYDLIRIEDLRIANMTRSARGTVAKPGRNIRQKAGLNRSIMAGGWGLFARRLQDKAPGRVEKVNPAYTSVTCSRCKHVDRNSRESQALFQCTACNYTANADLNAAINIAAGQAVRGVEKLSTLKRVPQLPASSAA